MSWDSWIFRNIEEDKKTSFILSGFKGFAIELGIITKSRKRDIVLTRWIFWTDVINTCEITQEAAGELTGGHDHATVINGLREFKKYKEIKDKLFEIALNEYNFNKKEYAKGNSI